MKKQLLKLSFISLCLSIQVKAADRVVEDPLAAGIHANAANGRSSVKNFELRSPVEVNHGRGLSPLLSESDCFRLVKDKNVALINKKMTDADFEILVPLLEKNESLTSLDLFGNQLGVKTAEILRTKFPQLESLNLGNTTSNKEGVRTTFDKEGVRLLAQHPGLKSLDLSGNNLTFEDVIELAHNTHLKILNLDNNLLGDFGAVLFSTTTTLSVLNLRRNQLTDLSAKALSCNTHLKKLLLGKNANITMDGAKHFLNKDNFEIVDLTDTKVEKNNQFKDNILVGVFPSFNPSAPKDTSITDLGDVDMNGGGFYNI